MSNRRWYDREPVCTRLLMQVKDMPQPETRIFCARVIVNFAEKLRRSIRKRKAEGIQLGALGEGTLANLYRYGQEKRRWYDQEAAVSQAVGMFYTLPPEGLAALGFQLGDTFGLIQVYAGVCDQLGHPPQTPDLVQICMTSLQTGISEAEAVLVDLVGQDLYDSLSRTKRPGF